MHKVYLSLRGVEKAAGRGLQFADVLNRQLRRSDTRRALLQKFIDLSVIAKISDVCKCRGLIVQKTFMAARACAT